MKGNCIVYGGGGFIGSHLCDKLLSEGYNVTVFDKLNFSKKNISHLTGKVKVIEGDFNNETDIQNSLKEIDYVFHLVSSTLPSSSNDNPEYDAETNLISSLKLFKESVQHKIKKIIFLSSGGTVYGIPDEIPVKESYSSNPICSYGIIKKTIEEYLFLFKNLYGLNYCVFRLANPYGERQNPFASQGVIPVFLKKVIDNDSIEIWGDGEIIRDYIYIKDAADVLSKSLSIDSDIALFNLSTGKGYSLNELISIISKVTGKKLNVKYSKARKIDVPVSILDNSLVKKTFAWSPKTPIEEGIRITHDYLLNLKKDE